MKIAIIGNMNNVLSPAAQWLAVNGHDVTVFLLAEYDHFLPEADYFDPDEIQFKIVNLNMEFGKVAEYPVKKLRTHLQNFDFYIGTDYAPALLARLGKRLHVFAPAGTDLYEWPFYPSMEAIPEIWRTYLILTSAYQRIGIRNCSVIPANPNAYFSSVLKEIKFRGKRMHSLPFLYYPLYTEDFYRQSAQRESILKIRAENELLLIQHGRQWWKSGDPKFHKGNDKVFRGFKKFTEAHPDLKVKLLLLEYGQDVADSKELLKELQLESYAIWLPKMLRRDLLTVIRYCDIGIGQIGEISWYMYCSNGEYLSQGVTYMGYRNDAYYRDKQVHLYTMLNASNEEEVHTGLEDYLTRRDFYVSKAAENKSWLTDFNMNEPMAEIRKLISECKTIPSMLPLSERIYLRGQEFKMFLARWYNNLTLLFKSTLRKLRVTQQ